MAKDTDDRKTEGEEADIGLDMSQTAVKKMIAEARDKGYITYDQLNNVLPPDQVSLRTDRGRDVDAQRDGHQHHRGRGSRRQRGRAQKGSTEVVTTGLASREVAVAGAEAEKLDRTDDPVRMYLREMGSVELLSREGEIAIAKRIEAGRNTMISGSARAR
jgi:RNA polymerase primary sigma factor